MLVIKTEALHLWPARRILRLESALAWRLKCGPKKHHGQNSCHGVNRYITIHFNEKSSGNQEDCFPPRIDRCSRRQAQQRIYRSGLPHRHYVWGVHRHGIVSYYKTRSGIGFLNDLTLVLSQRGHFWALWCTLGSWRGKRSIHPTSNLRSLTDKTGQWSSANDRHRCQEQTEVLPFWPSR